MSWQADVEATWLEFENGLKQMGFDIDTSGVLVGEVRYHDGAWERPVLVEITRGPGFPFRPPRVRPWDGSGTRSWHQERDGALCLYGAEGNADLPWLDPRHLLDRTVEWFSRDAAGWPDTPPDLDLERYPGTAPFPAMIVYQDIDQLSGKPIRLRRRGRSDVFEVAGTGVRPPGNSKKLRELLWGKVFDLGALDRPFHDWQEFAPLIGDAARGLEKQIRDGRIRVVLARYTRDGVSGVAALVATPEDDGSLGLRAVESADDSDVTRCLRAPDAASLRIKRVAVIGAGAVGGFIADMLARDGVGHLTLVDGERMRPGNCVRHILGYEYVGLNKAAGLRTALSERYGIDSREISVVEHALADGTEAEQLLRDHDLAINATASDLPTGLLNHAADRVGTPVLSVHLERAGELVVLHRRPLVNGVSNWDLPSDPRAPGMPLLEGGCGDPVARTAPHAAILAAALCSHYAVMALLGDPDDLPATVVQVLRPQEDPPLDAAATLERR